MRLLLFLLFLMPLLASDSVDEKLAREATMGCPLGLRWGMSREEVADTLAERWGHVKPESQIRGRSQKVSFARVVVSERTAVLVTIEIGPSGLAFVGMAFRENANLLLAQLEKRYGPHDKGKWMFPSKRSAKIIVSLANGTDGALLTYTHVEKSREFSAEWTAREKNDF